MEVIGTSIYPFCYLHIMQPFKNTLKNHHFTFYSEELLIVFSLISRILKLVDVGDYKTAMTIASSEAWKTAWENIKSTQDIQKWNYDQYSEESQYEVGNQVLVYMPIAVKGKAWKLTRPLFLRTLRSLCYNTHQPGNKVSGQTWSRSYVCFFG